MSNTLFTLGEVFGKVEERKRQSEIYELDKALKSIQVATAGEQLKGQQLRNKIEEESLPLKFQLEKEELYLRKKQNERMDTELEILKQTGESDILYKQLINKKLLTEASTEAHKKNIVDRFTSNIDIFYNNTDEGIKILKKATAMNMPFVMKTLESVTGSDDLLKLHATNMQEIQELEDILNQRIDAYMNGTLSEDEQREFEDLQNVYEGKLGFNLALSEVTGTKEYMTALMSTEKNNMSMQVKQNEEATKQAQALNDIIQKEEDIYFDIQMEQYNRKNDISGKLENTADFETVDKIRKKARSYALNKITNDPSFATAYPLAIYNLKQKFNTNDPVDAVRLNMESKGKTLDKKTINSKVIDDYEKRVRLMKIPSVNQDGTVNNRFYDVRDSLLIEHGYDLRSFTNSVKQKVGARWDNFISAKDRNISEYENKNLPYPTKVIQMNLITRAKNNVLMTANDNMTLDELQVAYIQEYYNLCKEMGVRPVNMNTNSIKYSIENIKALKTQTMKTLPESDVEKYHATMTGETPVNVETENNRQTIPEPVTIEEGTTVTINE